MRENRVAQCLDIVSTALELARIAVARALELTRWNDYYERRPTDPDITAKRMEGKKRTLRSAYQAVQNLYQGHGRGALADWDPSLLAISAQMDALLSDYVKALRDERDAHMVPNPKEERVAQDRVAQCLNIVSTALLLADTVIGIECYWRITGSWDYTDPDANKLAAKRMEGEQRTLHSVSKAVDNLEKARHGALGYWDPDLRSIAAQLQALQTIYGKELGNLWDAEMSADAPVLDDDGNALDWL